MTKPAATTFFNYLAKLTLLSASPTLLADAPDSFTPDSHAPVGIMGDHRHRTGEIMLSYRYMSMDMEDNLAGDNSISPAQIVSTLTNPFAPPATVRVVPVEMTTNMHMLGMMYAPNDKVTVMAMLNYLEKAMQHQTFMGGAGTTPLGTFTTRNSGIGDTKVGILWGLRNSATHKLHFNFNVSLPTGSIDETDTVLSPMNTRPTPRMPYAMQLGSGTFDLEPGITYYGNSGLLGWGAQAKTVFRLGENDEDYTLGDAFQISGWGSYRLANWLSGSLRLSYVDQDSIDGNDSAIRAPVTTANPDNYGGERLDIAIGFNAVNHTGHRFAFEYTAPIEQDVNGVQMEMQSMWTLGYQFTFY